LINSSVIIVNQIYTVAETRVENEIGAEMVAEQSSPAVVVYTV
jgi:hypothetical protein